MSPLCTTSDYFPFWAPTIKWTTEISIEEKDSIVAQLKEKDVEPRYLKAVVISHLHYDHSGGMTELHTEGAPIYISHMHWKTFSRPVFAAIEGCAPSHWPKKFTPNFLVPSGRAIGPFPHSYPITEDGKIVAVDTPGHVPGHVSLIVFAEETTFFLAGDAVYTIELLEKGETDGVNDDPKGAVETLRRIREFARGREVVVLPSHDWKSVEMLEGKIAFKPGDS
jgi:glyoxylase-like metal-dependent hydrolase (beta-lactamase superfamily II)